MGMFYNTAFAPIKQDGAPTTISMPARSKRDIPPAAGGGGARGKYRPLSSDEADKLYPKLVEYIKWQSEHADQFIIATVKGHDPTIVIWSDLDGAEIEILADYLIMRGRKDPITAQAVRYASEVLDRIKVAIIVVPRVYRTINLYLARGLDINIFIRPH